jgi:hypothetical protein
MIEAMKKEMDAESADDERTLRERILATETILARLLAQYIKEFGATPWALNLDVRQGAQFVSDEIETYDQRDPSGVLERERQIEQYEAAGGFADTDPDGMS